MDTILNYLNNMFSHLPQNEEVNRAKEEMAAMMEDKYLELKAEGKSENEAIGIVISEFGNMDELTKELGLENMQETTANAENKEKPLRRVTIKEGREYIDANRSVADKIAYGAMLCIMSPIALIVLACITDGKGAKAENMTVLVGLIVLFVMIAPAVALLIINSMKLGKYEYLKKERFQLENGGENLFKTMRDEETAGFGIRIAVGVSMCIAAVIPLLVVSILFENSNTLLGLSIGLLLIIVAFAVRIFVNNGMPYECYKVLLQEEEYSVKGKNDLSGKIAAIYWPLIVAIFLAYSFITNDWGRSWIIWPVAGVLFAAIAGICSMVNKEKD